MHALRIVLFSLAVMLAYGVLQDQISVRVCPDYFTVGRDSNWIETENGTLLALARGLRSSWGPGVFLGLALALTARLGKQPKLGVRELATPVVVFVLLLGTTALMAGVSIWATLQGAAITMGGEWGQHVPQREHVVFLAVGVVHFTTYLASVLGGLVLAGWVVRRRNELEARQAV